MIDQFCSFALGPLLLGFEARRVQEVLRWQPVTEVPLAPPNIRGLMNMRGQIVLVVDLRRTFGLPEADPGKSVHVLVHTRRGITSLLVDKLGDVLEIEADEFEPIPDNVRGEARTLLKGALKLPDRLLLHLDPDRVANSSA